MQARMGAALLLAATVAVAGPGATALHAGEAPSERGRPSERPSPGGGPQDTPPGQERQDDTGSTERPDGNGRTSDGTGSDPDTSAPGPSSQPTPTGSPQPPPPPEPNLTGTRVLRSSLGPPRTDGDRSVLLRDLQVVVTETEAAGIDGGWWVVVTAPEGDLTVAPSTLNTIGEGGVPRAPEARSRERGPLFSVTGQRSAQRYQGSYEATGTVGIPSEAAPERPVVTVLLIQ